MDQRPAVSLRTAGFVRRSLAVAIDALPALLIVAGLVRSGIFVGDLLRVPQDWFASEWWLHHWLNNPGWFFWPPGALVLIQFCWIIGWEQAMGRTPGAMLMGLGLRDCHGHQPSRSDLVKRHIAGLLHLPTLGLSYLWIIASRYRLGLHDLLSKTRVVVEGRPKG